MNKKLFFIFLLFPAFTHAECVEKNGAIVCKYAIDKNTIQDRVIKIPHKPKENMCRVGENLSTQKNNYQQIKNNISSWKINLNDKINFISSEEAIITITEKSCSKVVKGKCAIKTSNFSNYVDKQCFDKNNSAYINVFIKNCKKCQFTIYKEK